MHPYRLSQQTERGVYTGESDEPGHGFIEVCVFKFLNLIFR